MALEMPKAPGVDHRFVAAGGLNFHVARAGKGDPVLLVHGWPQHWYAWREVIPALAEHRRVLAIDLRGFGWTDIAWEGFEAETMADDLAGVLAELGIGRAAVVGHDWGGTVAFELALRRPELVERLVVLSAAPPWARPRRASLTGLRRIRHSLLVASPLGRLRLRGSANRAQHRPAGGARPRGVPARHIRRNSTSRANLGPEPLAIYNRDLAASTRARAGALLHRTLLRDELRARPLRPDTRLATPTLLLHGARDPLFDRRALRDRERHADDLRTEEVDGAGHYLPEEAPQLIAARVLEFIEAGRGRRDAALPAEVAG